LQQPSANRGEYLLLISGTGSEFGAGSNVLGTSSNDAVWQVQGTLPPMHRLLLSPSSDSGSGLFAPEAGHASNAEYLTGDEIERQILISLPDQSG
jgi:hypothetical protein